VTKLRRDHRIVGSFIGSLPSFTRQNNELGLPLLLMNEEAKLLVDKGVARIVRYQFFVDNDVKQYYEQMKNEFYQQNYERFKSERKEAILKIADKIVAGKMKKYSCDQQLDRKEIEAKIIQQEIDKIPDFSPNCCATKLYTSCPLDNRKEMAVDWNYPNTRQDMIRYSVFQDMWNKNYYLTNGMKFGCDFLAYENDPISYHSKYMIICKTSEQQLSEQQIQTYGRLAKSVRKNILISINYDIIQCNDTNNSNIEYLTIKWQNNR